jgi:hypothetical protein
MGHVLRRHKWKVRVGELVGYIGQHEANPRKRHYNEYVK